MVISSTGKSREPVAKDKIEEAGWNIVDEDKIPTGWLDYQDFINASCGEFSVAKETYVKANTGWFSCRSACYLAAGRPVITQDTGWSKFIPSGNGLFAFTDIEEAVAAIHYVKKNLPAQSRAAREIALQYFDSAIVLNDLLKKIE